MFCQQSSTYRLLNTWLSKYNPPREVHDKYVWFDPSSNLGKYQDILNLFEAVGYDTKDTAPGHPHQNDPVEHPNHTIGNALCAMLAGSRLSPSIGNMPFTTIYVLAILLFMVSTLNLLLSSRPSRHLTSITCTFWLSNCGYSPIHTMPFSTG